MIIDLPYQKIAGNTYPWYRSMDRFNFAKGGHVSYKADIWSLDGYEEIGNSTSLVLLACKPEPARQLTTGALMELCTTGKVTALHHQGDFNEHCPLVLAAPCDTSKKFDSETQLWLYLVKCPGPPMALEIDLTLENPGDEYLSLEMVHYPVIYQVICTLWLPVLLFCLAGHQRFASGGNFLQRILFLVPLTKLVSSLLIYKYFDQASQTGHYPAVVPFAFSLTSLMQNMSFYGMMMMLAKGFYISRNQLPWNEVKTIFVAVLGYSITTFIYSTDNFYLWVFWLMMFIVVASIILYSARYTYMHLQTQFERRSNAEQPGADVLLSKLHAFSKFIMYYFLYFITDMVSHIFSYSMPQTDAWICTALQELTHLCFVVAAGTILCPGPEIRAIFSTIEGALAEERARDLEAGLDLVQINIVEVQGEDARGGEEDGPQGPPMVGVEMGCFAEQGCAVCLPGSDLVLVQHPGGTMGCFAMAKLDSARSPLEVEPLGVSSSSATPPTEEGPPTPALVRSGSTSPRYLSSEGISSFFSQRLRHGGQSLPAVRDSEMIELLEIPSENPTGSHRNSTQ